MVKIVDLIKEGPVNFVFGVGLGILIESIPIQDINHSQFLLYSYCFLIGASIIVGLLSILLKFYVSTFRLVMIGIWFGSFVFSTFELFRWILGDWELISGVFRLILPLYFVTLYQVLEAIQGKPVEDVI
jgi:hypothetical protein